jgi:hypothetical protein
VNLKLKTITSLDNVFDVLSTKEPEILVTLGAGSIDTLVPLIKRRYEAC